MCYYNFLLKMSITFTSRNVIKLYNPILSSSKVIIEILKAEFRRLNIDHPLHDSIFEIC